MNHIVTKEHVTILGLRLSALIEMLLSLVALTVVDAFFFDGHRFWDVNPHPFWVVVLVIAVQYGTAEGLLATVFATAFYLVGNMPESKEGVAHFTYIYTLSINPILWLVAGWILGELRQRHIRERNRLTRGLEESQQRENLISDSHRRRLAAGGLQ